jgi:predicted nuclease with TOPRIM domain
MKSIGILLILLNTVCYLYSQNYQLTWQSCFRRLKATNRTKELKALKKREKELITSRNNVKAKNNDLRLKIKELEKENTKLKYELKKK